MELAPAAGIVADDLAFSGEEVFVGDKAFEADGTAGVELAGADADFGTKAVAEAVREAGGAVAVDTGGVDHLLEACCGCIVAGEDGVGVVGAVAVDVVDGLFDIGDHLEGDNEIQILCAEIFVLHDIDGVDLDRCIVGAGDQILGLLCAAKLNAGAAESPGKFGEKVRGYISVDENGLNGIAGSGVLGLGVDNDLDRHVFVDIFVHIDVADSVRMSHDRDLCVVHDVLNELIGSSRNDEIDIIVKTEHLSNISSGCDEMEPAFRKSCVDTCLADNRSQSLVCIDRFRPALKEYGIAALDAEGCYLNQCVRSALENNSDNADRTCNACKLKTVIKSSS